MKPEIELKVAQTAFNWLGYDHYGSEKKALRALLRRKGLEQLERESAAQYLAAAVDVFNRTNQLRLAIASKFGKPDVPYLTRDQFEQGSDQIKETLYQEYPELKATVNHMIAMIWDMGYWR